MSVSFPPWNDDHQAIRTMVRQFCEERLAPHRYDWDKAGQWPAREVFQEMAGLGLLGIKVEEEYGGMGLDWWFNTAFAEELRHCRNGGVVMSVLVNTDMATGVIGEIGTPEQKQEFLAPMVAGEKIAALGVTEPGCGSDVANIQTTARMDGGDFVINGAKTFITNGAIADFITLAVRTGDPGFAGVSLVLFPTDTPGFSVGRKLDKLGTRSADSCEIAFDNCRIPQRYLLGSLNGGFIHIMQNFQGERLCGAIMGVGAMDMALKDALQYGTERHAFGRPIGKFQVWRHKFAEHLTSVQAARLLTYNAVQLMIAGEEPTVAVSMAKLFAADLAQRVIYDCMQFHGGYGYIEEYDISRAYRDMRLLPIGGGTSEVMKEIISKLHGM
jgi:citronellyl-CoA dehydrogenase